MLKIINWNIERLSKISSVKANDMLIAMDADIVVLTETHRDVCLSGEYHACHSTRLGGLHEGITYQHGEVRTAICSKFPIINTVETFDEHTNCAVLLDSPLGTLLVYAAIIGVFGNRHKNFREGLQGLVADIRSIPSNSQMIIAGDFNQSFSDDYYFTHDGRNQALQLTEEQALSNITAYLPQNIDHILISSALVRTANVAVKIFNADKRHSDHIGIIVEIS